MVVYTVQIVQFGVSGNSQDAPAGLFIQLLASAYGSGLQHHRLLNKWHSEGRKWSTADPTAYDIKAELTRSARLIRHVGRVHDPGCYFPGRSSLLRPDDWVSTRRVRSCVA